jgi:transposase
MMKAFKFRVYPTQGQVTRLERTLDICRELYNAALQERRDAWRIARKSVSCYEQQNQLPHIKSIRPELGCVRSQVLQDVLRRLDKAFDAFFRRVKSGDKAGALVMPVTTAIGVYAGIKVALAEIRRDIKRHDDEIGDLKADVRRLEAPYFSASK